MHHIMLTSCSQRDHFSATRAILRGTICLHRTTVGTLIPDLSAIDRSVPPEKRFPTIVLGYVKPGGKITLFGGDQSKIRLKLNAEDKIIVFTNH